MRSEDVVGSVEAARAFRGNLRSQLLKLFRESATVADLDSSAPSRAERRKRIMIAEESQVIHRNRMSDSLTTKHSWGDACKHIVRRSEYPTEDEC